MAKPKGAPKTGGRKVGTPNKSTAEIKELAQQYAPEAIAELARLMKEAESDAAKVSAIKEILDRAYGKSPQALQVGGDPDGTPLKHVIETYIIDPVNQG